MVLAAVFVLGASFIYLRHQVYYSRGVNLNGGVLLVEKGDNVLTVGNKLKKQGLVAQKVYFMYYYVLNNNILHKLPGMKAGVYQIPDSVTVPEIARIISQANLGETQIKSTFPEGWTMKEMAVRLRELGLPGDEFLAIAEKPPIELRQEFVFLRDLPEDATLEGYLFPDTYFFAKDSSGREIVERMLKNFDNKIPQSWYVQIAEQNKSFRQILIMASIVEGEVFLEDDRKLVSGLFWHRLAIEQPLQSDATLEYILGGNKKKHSLEETQMQSPYNTYRVKGLPPGPVNNPGIAAISAALNPQQSEYLYFLSDLTTGKTIFAKTFQEHIANKAKFGL